MQEWVPYCKVVLKYFGFTVHHPEMFFGYRNSPCIRAPSAVVNVRMTNILMLLRKCCNHPYLLECPLEEGTLLRRVDEEIVTSSGKMLLLDRMLPVLKKRGHKVCANVLTL